MGLAHSLQRARKRLDALDSEERTVLLAICRDIRRAQASLSRKAGPIMVRCMARCRGLCCRNIRVADILTEWDLVYILALAPELEACMAACLEREGLFAADCLFLENGIGPCLFPEHVRPERCIISFCRVEPRVEAEIGRVMHGFSRLIRFFTLHPCRRLLRRWRRRRVPAIADGCASGPTKPPRR